jgi:hypothetical protein
MPRLLRSRLFAMPTSPTLLAALLVLAVLLAGLILAVQSGAAVRADSDIHLAPMRWDPPDDPIG